MGRTFHDGLAPRRAILNLPGAVHVAYRLAARSTIAGTLGCRSSRRQRAALAAAAVADVVVGAALARRPGSGMGPRLIADSLESAYWSRQLESADPAALLGMPLAFESGMLMDPRGMAATATGAAAVAFSRRARGMSTGIGAFRWHGIGAASGFLFTLYERYRQSEALARHRAAVAARCQWARLAGQNDVAMGADSVIDLLSRTSPLLRLPDSDAADPLARQLAAWKQSLADETTASATYVGVVVARWQRRTNDAHPDLAADVVIDMAPGDGTVVLSVAQAGHLVRALDALDLRGRVRMSVVQAGRGGPPDQPVAIDIGDRRVTIPPDQGGRLGPVDVGPIAFVISALWALDRASAQSVMIRKEIAGALAASNLGLAVWSHREIARRGRQARPSVLLAAVALAAVDAVTVTRSVRQPVNRDGWVFFSAATSIAAPIALTAMYWRDLSPRQRSAGIVGTIGVLALGIAVDRRRPGLGSIALELVWPIAAMASVASLDQAMGHVGDELTRSLRAEDERLIAAAFDEGRAAVIELARQHYGWVRSTYDERRDALDEGTRAELERRIAEVAGLLEAL